MTGQQHTLAEFGAVDPAPFSAEIEAGAMKRERAPNQSSVPPSEKVIWLLPVRPPQWRGVVWAGVEDHFGHCGERLFHSRTTLVTAEGVLAAADERLHRPGHT